MGEWSNCNIRNRYFQQLPGSKSMAPIHGRGAQSYNSMLSETCMVCLIVASEDTKRTAINVFRGAQSRVLNFFATDGRRSVSRECYSLNDHLWIGYHCMEPDLAENLSGSNAWNVSMTECNSNSHFWGDHLTSLSRYLSTLLCRERKVKETSLIFSSYHASVWDWPLWMPEWSIWPQRR